MYCSGCGTRLGPNLNYCKQCGSRVPNERSNSVAENLSQAITYIGAFGLMGFIFGIYLMTRSGVAAGPVIVISFLYLATLFGICYLILPQTAPFTLKKKNSNPEFHDAVPLPYLSPVTTAQLPDAINSPLSVTEHTTRTLEEVPVDRKRGVSE